MAKKLSMSDLQASPSGAAETKFCKSWPDAKIALTAFQNITKNFFIKTVISLVMAAGDTYAATKCTT